jgi:hypothetical protein
MNKVKHSIILLFFFGNFFSQKDTLKKFNLCFETITHTNGFLRLFAKESVYQGQTFLFSIQRKISKKAIFGLSTGIFYYNDFQKQKMKYTYFPIYVFFQKTNKNDNFFRFSLGKSFLSYFDSEYTYYERFIYNDFWLKKSNINNYDYEIKNRGFWFILSFMYGYKINKKLVVTTATQIYFTCHNLFKNINFGLIYNLY